MQIKQFYLKKKYKGNLCYKSKYLKGDKKMLNIKKISIPLEISIYQVQQRNLSVQITLYTVFKLFVGIAFQL